MLCDRMGPYHYARATALRRWADVVTIEYSALDETYAWDQVRDRGEVGRVTLFSDKPISSHSRGDVVARVRKALFAERPQILAIPGWDAPASLIALAWAVETGTPTVLMSDSQQHDESRWWWKEVVKTRVVRLHGAGFVAGRRQAAYLEALGMSRDRVVLGVDAIDNEHFAAGAAAAVRDERRVRERLLLPAQYFLSACRFVTEKNVQTLIRAYARYRARVGSRAWSLVLVGDGPLMPAIMRLRAELGVTDAVHLMGFRQYDELPAFYGLAGVFVLASTREPWGLVVNEAMAAGLPVLVSGRCGCAHELVAEGRNGFLLDPLDADALAAQLERLADDRELRRRMGDASREIVGHWGLERFDRGLQEAAEIARTVPQRHASVADRGLLWGLSYRGTRVHRFRARNGRGHESH